LLSALLAGGTVVLRRGFDETDFCTAVETHGVTWTFLVPTMLYRLLDGPLAVHDVSSLENVIYGAAPIRPDRLREALDRLGPVLTQFYGQTEVPNLITTLDRRDHARVLEDGDDRLLRSAGQPCLLSEVKVVDPDTGEERGPDEPGELLVRAPYTFDGYFGLPEATDETLVDGWVQTGDVGRIDDEGYLYLLDRRNDVVVTGGMNVYTSEVERALGEHRAVGDVAVIGVPDEEWGVRPSTRSSSRPRDRRSMSMTSSGSPAASGWRATSGPSQSTYSTPFQRRRTEKSTGKRCAIDTGATRIDGSTDSGPVRFRGCGHRPSADSTSAKVACIRSTTSSASSSSIVSGGVIST